MLPLFGPMLVSLQDPLVLRCHARWTKVMALRVMRLAARRRAR
jgi:hypothetical protein